MEVDARAARDERDLAGVAGDRPGLGSERHGGDPVRGRGPAALDGEGEAGEAAGQVDGGQSPSRLCAMRRQPFVGCSTWIASSS